jgi:hypothetical protein
MKSQNFGEIFANCNTEKQAGRNANAPLGPDYSLVDSFGNTIITQGEGGLLHFNWEFYIVVPGYPSAKSALYNVLNHRDLITNMEIITLTRGAAGGSNKYIEKYTCKNGRIMTLGTSSAKGNEGGVGELSLSIDFEDMIHDNLETNTSGELRTSTV